MYSTDSSGVLRCPQCNKPFDKESTLKRHGYYCRSRNAPTAARPRSCVSCAKLKARCDRRVPSCSKCTSKSIECHYPESVTKTPRKETSSSAKEESPSSVTTEASGAQNAYHVTPTPGGEDTMLLDSSFSYSRSDLAPFSNADYMDWGDLQSDFTGLFDPQMNLSANLLAASGDSQLLPQVSSSDNIQFGDLLFPENLIPMAPALNPRKLIPRVTTERIVQKTSNTMLRTLKSYPFMILRHNSLPPYIHSTWLSEKSTMEPLTNCVSVMQMVKSETPGSRKLFWKNIRMECERLYEECQTLDRWELLAALQALSIYILFRIDEGETEHNNVDSLLVTAVAALSQQLNQVLQRPHPGMFEAYNHHLDISWEEWIFDESLRRICLIYQILGMLIYFEPASMCDHPDLILGCLPAKKQLWEATDKTTWKAERHDASAQSALALAATGDLVDLGPARLSDQTQVYDAFLQARNLPKSSASWQEWCSGMDGLGWLVMLTSDLVI